MPQSRPGAAQLFCTAVLALLLLGGCGGGPLPVPVLALPRPTPAGLTPGPVKLTLWHSETGAGRQALEAMVADFGQAYPDIQVSAEYVGPGVDLANQVSAALAVNSAPTLVLADRRAISQFARQDGLVPLDSFLDDLSTGLSADDRADFFPGLLDEGVFVNPKQTKLAPTPTLPAPTEASPNQPLDFDRLVAATPVPTSGPAVLPVTATYAIPFDASALFLYVNLEVLKSKFQAPPTTWADFSRMGRELTRGDTVGWTMVPSAAAFQALVRANGGQVLDNTARNAIFNGPGGLKALAVISELSKSGAARMQPTEEKGRTDFASGKSAFFIAGSEEVRTIAQAIEQNKPFQWSIVNLPAAPNVSPTTVLSSRDWAIFKSDSDRVRAAWFFIRWMTASEQTARWSRATHAIPLRASSLAYLATDLVTDERLRWLKEGFGATVPLFVPRYATKFAVRIDGVLEDLWRQTVDSQDTNLQDSLNIAAGRASRFLQAP